MNHNYENDPFTESLKEGLNFISVELNHSCDVKAAVWTFFDVNSHFSALAACLEYLIRTLVNFKLNAFEMCEKNLKNLLEIIHKLVSHSFDFGNKFLESGMLNLIVDVFKNTKLLKHLYQQVPAYLYKIVGIFFHLSRFSMLSGLDKGKMLRNYEDAFSDLRKSRDEIKKMSEEERQPILK